MASALAVQHCRISAPDKLPDRLLASGVLGSPEHPGLNEQVVLLYLFEVARPWFASSTLIPSLTAVLEAEHARLTPGGNLDDQFERLLKSVNQELNRISEGGETDWIGTLSGMIMVMSGDELHFSQTGRCPAYLLQNNRIRQITDDPSIGQEPHPARTFANLASGHLIEGDRFLIANQELYNEISLDALRRIINTSSPFGSCGAIARELKRVKNAGASCVIVSLENVAALPVAEPESILMEEEMQGALKKLGKKLAPVVAATKQGGAALGAAGAKAAAAGSLAVKEKVAPKASEILKKGISKLATPAETTATEALAEERPVVEIIQSRTKSKRIHLEAIAAAAAARAEHGDEEEAEAVREPEPTPKATGEHPALTFAKVAAPRLAKTGLAATIEWLKPMRNKQIAAMGVAVLLIVTVVGSALTSSGGSADKSTESSNVTTLREIQLAQQNLAVAVSQGNSDAAAALISEATKKLNGLSDLSEEQKAEADTLWKSIETQSDTLTNGVRLDEATASYAIASGQNGFITGLPYFYGWSGLAGISRTGRGDASQTQATIKLTDPADAIIAAAKTSERDTVGYALTRQQKVARITQIGTSTVLTPISPTEGSFEAGEDIATYNGNIYILNGTTGLLWRYANTNQTYGKGFSVIDLNKYDIKKSVSIAIDGSIYLLKSDGSLVRFTQGKQDADFSLKNVPYNGVSMIQPSQVVTDSTYPNIYILDAGSASSSRSSATIFEYAKDGTYVRQYAFPMDVTKVKSFDINPKDKKLWVMTDASILEFDLP